MLLKPWFSKIRRWWSGPRWIEYKKEYKEIVFCCRYDPHTGNHQVLSAGPLGDGEWKPVEEAFRQDWEKAWFDNAKIEETAC